MSLHADPALPPRMHRDGVTWYCYLANGYFTYLLNLQGNVLPFLQSEQHLSYRVASLHFSAIALGQIMVGLFGNAITQRLGRTRTLWMAGVGLVLAALLEGWAPHVGVSLLGCLLIGFPGALVPGIVFGLLGEVQGRHKDVAFAEVSALSYIFGIIGPFAIVAFLWMALGWRPAVLLGGVMGLVITLAFRNLPIANAADSKLPEHVRLPAAYWAFWCLMICCVALEFSVLFWAPAFLERVAGLSTATAAGSAAIFSVAMITARFAGSVAVKHIAPTPLMVGALVLTAVGFGFYWGIGHGWAALLGLFLLGLGIAPLYPLTVGMALQAAGPQSAAASAKFMLAVGLSIMSMPTLLGGLADKFGLSTAHLTLPALMIAALICLFVGRALVAQHKLRNLAAIDR